jgi:mono/diheme cytochrome c family protein
MELLRRQGLPLSLAAALSLMAATMLGAAAVQAQGAAPAFAAKDDVIDDLPAGAGREETFALCTACHGYKIVSNQGLSREKWDETLTYMTQRHNMPALEGDDRETILKYLAEMHPPRAPRGRGFANPFATE